MKLIDRTDMRHHVMGVKAWPRWCFNLWALGCGDLIAVDYIRSGDGAEFQAWKSPLWWIRGNILRAIFTHLWWWV